MTPSPSLSTARASSEQRSVHSDRPERSRNAKAQARHRAKRKAYIEQLEQTVTKLQTVLALSPDQVAALPPPLLRIRELEQENELLHRELDELRQQVELRNAQLRPDVNRREHFAVNDDRRSERDLRRRRTVESGDIYLHSNEPHSHSPPPPLMIPSSTHFSQHSPQAIPYPKSQSSTLYPSYGLSYQMPGTPSGSSTTSASSPSFSPSDYMPSPHSQHRAAPSPISNVLSQYSHTPTQYELVKLEEDPYSRHNVPHANGYSVSLPPFASNQPALNHWHAYSSERA
ncbi:hypothetical protein SCP_0505560 [Sparassis crispa]|uniref:BZIP domain-containing protein n=1 Tax=Sparassis crispa TaxID=139825 RepID=A0A401GMR4_9APHY|nr:hypothetical protein SCP_0505560 [Sparassis crispa]GBE83505.1 hypothetical protein SCP_0505560 [Sparassis crispa]